MIVYRYIEDYARFSHVKQHREVFALHITYHTFTDILVAPAKREILQLKQTRGNLQSWEIHRVA